jgi:hypothetical protein
MKTNKLNGMITVMAEVMLAFNFTAYRDVGDDNTSGPSHNLDGDSDAGWDD